MPLGRASKTSGLVRGCEGWAPRFPMEPRGCGARALPAASRAEGRSVRPGGGGGHCAVICARPAEPCLFGRVHNSGDHGHPCSRYRSTFGRPRLLVASCNQAVPCHHDRADGYPAAPANHGPGSCSYVRPGSRFGENEQRWTGTSRPGETGKGPGPRSLHNTAGIGLHSPSPCSGRELALRWSSRHGPPHLIGRGWRTRDEQGSEDRTTASVPNTRIRSKSVPRRTRKRGGTRIRGAGVIRNAPSSYVRG